MNAFEHGLKCMKILRRHIMEMCYSVYFTDHEGNEVRDKSFMDREEANQYAQNSRDLHKNGARVIIEEKYW
jgi:hypothetical protein